jgi:hypothetical protein
MIPERFRAVATARKLGLTSERVRPMSKSEYRRFMGVRRNDSTPTSEITERHVNVLVQDVQHVRYHGVSNGLGAMAVFGPLWTKTEMKRSSREVSVPIRPIMNVKAEPIRYRPEDKVMVKDNRTVGMMAEEQRTVRREMD